jgi:glycine/serine hydroxymethyltransferase
MQAIADLIARALDSREDPASLAAIRGEVGELAGRFPLYPSRLAASLSE